VRERVSAYLHERAKARSDGGWSSPVFASGASRGYAALCDGAGLLVAQNGEEISGGGGGGGGSSDDDPISSMYDGIEYRPYRSPGRDDGEVGAGDRDYDTFDPYENY